LMDFACPRCRRAGFRASAAAYSWRCAYCGYVIKAEDLEHVYAHSYMTGTAWVKPGISARSALAQIEERSMSIVEKLKGLSLDRLEFEESLELHGHATLILGTYNEFSIEPPAWLVEAVESLKKHIKERSRDAIARELKLAEAELEKLKSAEDKRVDAKARIERLKTALGGQ
jgi:ribosomal protein L37AE/L43A